MFVRQNQQQFRNSNADVQIFYGSGETTLTAANAISNTWNKPPGVSHVYILLISAGGGGNGSSAGASAGVTVWYGSAQNVPDTLMVNAGAPGIQASASSRVSFRNGSSTFALVSAGAATGVSPGGAQTAGTFAASGFYQSVAGQAGASGTQTASSTTFLSGGSGGGGSTLTTNYGYVIPSPSGGFFMLQPIIVGAGGNDSGDGGIGCGGGVTAGTKGGPGMVLIASW